MKMTIQGTKNAATQEYAKKRLSKLDQYFKNPDAVSAKVLVKPEGTQMKVEVTIPTKHLLLRCEALAPDATTAIDIALDKLDVQLRRHKNRISSSIRQRTGLKGEHQAEEELDLATLSPLDDVQRIVKEKDFSLEPLDREEAILAMEMSGHDFYVYMDKGTHKTCIVYARRDGNYGVIVTDPAK